MQYLRYTKNLFTFLYISKLMVHPFLLSFAKSGILTLTASQKHNLGRYKLAPENKPSTKNRLIHSGEMKSSEKSDCPNVFSLL